MIDASLHLPAACLHKAFSDRSGVPPDHFELYYRGKRLKGEGVLSSYGISKDATIEVKMRGRGGMLELVGSSGRSSGAGGNDVGGGVRDVEGGVGDSKALVANDGMADQTPPPLQERGSPSSSKDYVEEKLRDAQEAGIKDIMANDKKHLLSEDETQIRATQGHDMPGVGEKPGEPLTLETAPEVAVHGSYVKHVQSILQQGLSRMERHHVHLAKGLLGEDGVISGMRSNAEVFIWVNVHKAIKDRLTFYESTNGVILCSGLDGDGILPPAYFSFVVELHGRFALATAQVKLLKHAFEGCSRVVVTKLHGGFSGSLVLKTDSYGLGSSRDKPTSTVTKLDDAESLLKELGKNTQFTALIGTSAAYEVERTLLANTSGKLIEAKLFATKNDHGCVVLNLKAEKPFSGSSGMLVSPSEGGALGLSAQYHKKTRFTPNAWHSEVLSAQERELYHAIMKPPLDRTRTHLKKNGIHSSLIKPLLEILKEKKKGGETLSPHELQRKDDLKATIDAAADGGPPGWRKGTESFITDAAREKHARRGQVFSNEAGDIWWTKTSTRMGWDRAEKWAKTKGREHALKHMQKPSLLAAFEAIAAEQKAAKDPRRNPHSSCLENMECRLLTSAEMKDLLDEVGPLWPEDDQWCAVIATEADNIRSFINVGDWHWLPGQDHNETFGYPDWGDNPDIQYPGFGHARWIQNVAWTARPSLGSGGSDEDGDEDDEKRADSGTVISANHEAEIEALDLLKAKTMFNMVEDIQIESVQKKLLFLTNLQADLITKNEGNTTTVSNSIKLLFDAFQASLQEPKLVINLLRSQGTIADVLGKCEDGLKRPGEWVADGRVRGVHSWENLKQALCAEKQLDTFMAQVLIPIASENNAVVICDCLKGDCFLSASFNRVMALQAARYGGRPPITVLSFSCDLEILYRNPDKGAVWRELRDRSKTWKARERGPVDGSGRDGILALLRKQAYFKEYGHADLDPSATSYIIVDGINERKGEWGDKKSFNNLKVAVIRYLTDSVARGGKALPSIALKTGYSKRLGLENSCHSSSSLGFAIDCLESNQQLLFIDLRKRGRLSAALNLKSQERIDEAKQRWLQDCHTIMGVESDGETPIAEKECDKLAREATWNSRQDRACDVFDSCAAAFFSLALRPSRAEAHERNTSFLPLCKAIEEDRKRAAGGCDGSTDSAGSPAATVQQIDELAWWLAMKFSEMAFEVYYHYKVVHTKDNRIALRALGVGKYAQGEEKEKLLKKSKADCTKPDHVTLDDLKPVMKQGWMKKELDAQSGVGAMATHLSKLFKSDRFHGCNVYDVQGAERLVTTLVKQDRLPPRTNPQGLELLQLAWIEHDVAIYLAFRYSVMSKLFMVTYLVLGVAIVVFTVLHAEDGVLLDQSVTDRFSHVIFGLSVALSFVLSLQTYLNPTARASQLSSSAASLESLTWLYRARVGQFERSVNEYSKETETALMVELNAWREELIAGTDLKETDLERIYPDKVYTHYQYSCPNEKLDEAKMQAEELQAELEKTRAQGCSARIAPSEGKGADDGGNGGDGGGDGQAGGGGECSRLTPNSRCAAARACLSSCLRRRSSCLSWWSSISASNIISNWRRCLSFCLRHQEKRQERQKSRVSREHYSLPAHLKFFNDHQSPVSANAYIALRIMPAIHDYKTKIPLVSRLKNGMQLVLFACTGAGAALSYADYAQYVAIISAVATSISSWMAFQMLGQRLLRYTSTVRALEQLLSWWASLGDGGKAGEAKISRLVQMGEQIITAERLAWRIMKESDDDKKGDSADAMAKGDASKGGASKGGTAENGEQ